MYQSTNECLKSMKVKYNKTGGVPDFVEFE